MRCRLETLLTITSHLKHAVTSFYEIFDTFLIDIGQWPVLLQHPVLSVFIQWKKDTASDIVPEFANFRYLEVLSSLHGTKLGST